jgi:hypothetical protein
MCVVMLMSGVLLETLLSIGETQGKLFMQSSTDAYIRQVGNLTVTLCCCADK